MLAKWDVLRVVPPGVGHTKYAVCICPRRLWFFYINSERPMGRRRGPLAIPLSAFHATFLRKECYLDTTQVPDLAPEIVRAAANDPQHRLGSLSPTVRTWVVACVRGHNALEPEQHAAVLDGEA